MFKNSGTYLLYGNRYCGIEHSSKNNTPIIYVSILKKTKKEVLIDTLYETESIKDVAPKLSKDIACCLVINNEQVITKKITSDQKERLKIVNTAFPNINLNDFIYEVIQQKSSHFVSICRTSYVGKLISEYQEIGVSIIDVSLRNSIIANSLGFIKEQEIYTSNALISVNNQEITSIKAIEDIGSKAQDINGLEVSKEQMLSFNAALTLLLGTRKTESNFESNRHLLLSDFKQSVFFRKFLKVGGLLIFLLLLVNFLFFNYYFNKVGILQQTSQVNQEVKSKIIGLTEKLDKSQKTVDMILNGSTSKSSYYINSIIQSLPSSIQLSEINYQPLTKRIKASEPIVYDADIILISGDSSNSELFSYWIKDLENESWIKKVDISRYSDSSNPISSFGLKLTITHD